MQKDWVLRYFTNFDHILIHHRFITATLMMKIREISQNPTPAYLDMRHSLFLYIIIYSYIYIYIYIYICTLYIHVYIIPKSMHPSYHHIYNIYVKGNINRDVDVCVCIMRMLTCSVCVCIVYTYPPPT